MRPIRSCAGNLIAIPPFCPQNGRNYEVRASAAPGSHRLYFADVCGRGAGTYVSTACPRPPIPRIIRQEHRS